VELFLLDHVAVVDVRGDVGAELFLDVVGGAVAMHRVDVGRGNQVDVRAGLLELDQRLHVGTKAAAARADKADADLAVGSGGLGGSRRLDERNRGARRGGGSGGLQKVATIDLVLVHGNNLP